MRKLKKLPLSCVKTNFTTAIALLLRFERSLLFILLAVVLFFGQAVHAQVSPGGNKELSEKPTYRIGILAYRDKESTLERWQPLIDYLEKQLNDFHFKPVIMHLSELEQAVSAKKVDFVLTHPGHYVLMSYRDNLTSPLASMLNLEGDFVTNQFGGVIFTRHDRDDIVSLKDLENKTIAAVKTTSLGAYQMQAYELLQQGIQLPQDVTLLETGQPQPLAVEAVLSGRADVGFVRTGVLEKLSQQNKLDLNRLKLINAQKRADFPFVTSTRLYPEWPFAAMAHVNKNVARQVASQLLSIPRKGTLAKSMDIAGFTISGDYRTIDRLMRDLNLPPFDKFELSAEELVEHWLKEIMIGLGLFITLIMATLLFMVQRQRLLKQERQRLREALEQLRLLNQAVEQSPEAIVITDVQSHILYMNPAFEAMTGYTRKEVKNQNPRMLQSGGTPKTVYQQMWNTLLKGKVWRGELSNKRRDGEVYPVHSIIAPVKDQTGEVVNYLSIQQDLSDQRQAQQRIHDLLYVDELTGLGNRNALLKTMDASLANLQSQTTKGCLLMLNMKQFRFVNNLYGPDVGDILLQMVGRRLGEVFAGDNLVVRLVADEFAVFCENKAEPTDINGWMKIMGQKAISALSSEMRIKGEVLVPDFAVGVAPFQIEEKAKQLWSNEQIYQVFEHAEIALKEARNQEDIRLTLYDANLSAQILAAHQLQLELREAIDHNQLRLFVQPQVMQNWQLAGLECLVRWQHPEKGLMSPGYFIPQAEKSDLIVALGDWVLRQACNFLAKIQQQSPQLTLSVNISPRHFRQAGFVKSVQQALNSAGAKPSGLVIEITESLFLDDFKDTVKIMRKLKALGIRFSIDDFGTGYSSLSYLQHLPVDELKIDRAFILGMEKEGVEGSLVSSIYAIAKQLKLKVVAEGIETNHQHGLLKQFDDMLLQGFLFAKPQESAQWFEQWQETLEPPEQK